MATDKLVDFDHVTDYISREAAIELLTMALDDEWEPEYATDRMNEIPAADVRPVVRGKWKHDGSDWKNRFICDQCGYKWFFEAEEAHFCPNCGADMRPERRAEE